MNVEVVLWFAGSFMAGSFPTGYVAGRLHGTDLRRHGSGNVGATNALRVMGKPAGYAVFAVDFLKGFLPVWLCLASGEPWASRSVAIWIGISSMLGHVFTPFLGFKGGKGVATGAGVLAAAYPLLALGAIGAWIAVFVPTRIVSLSSVCALGFLNVLGWIYGVPPGSAAGFLFGFLFTCWTHRANLKRLREGSEPRMGSKRSKN